MNVTKHVGRIGVLAVALGVGLSVTAPPGTATAADATALLVCGSACPTWRDSDVELIMDQFISPNHPGRTIAPVAVTTPQEYWPLTGVIRLLGLAIGDPAMFGPGGGAWPDAPWWKLSGLFDLTINQSILAGATDLETAMAEYGDDNLVIYGYSQGAAVAVTVKRRLAEQYPHGTEAPDISFVLGGDTNLPNGGLNARFPGLYIPFLDLMFNGAEPTDTQFHTDVITRQYDGAADFPLYPLNVIADVNAVLGLLYLHSHPLDVSLPADPMTSPAYQGTHGDSSYYFFETQDLPLFAPLRMIGVPEPLIDVVEPFFRVLVELGYDRSIAPWEPTPARLLPALDPATTVNDLADAVAEGVAHAAALFGAPESDSPPPAAMRQLGSADTVPPIDTEPPVTRVLAADAPESTEPSPTTGEVAGTVGVNDESSGQEPASGPPTATVDPTSPPVHSVARRGTSRPLVRDSLDANAITGNNSVDVATDEGSSSVSLESASPNPGDATVDDSSGDDSPSGSADGE